MFVFVLLWLLFNLIILRLTEFHELTISLKSESHVPLWAWTSKLEILFYQNLRVKDTQWLSKELTSCVEHTSSYFTEPSKLTSPFLNFKTPLDVLTLFSYTDMDKFFIGQLWKLLCAEHVCFTFERFPALCSVLIKFWPIGVHWCNFLFTNFATHP